MRHLGNRLWLVLCVLLAVPVAGSTAGYGQDPYWWNGPAGGWFHEPGNWIPPSGMVGPPGPADAAVFHLGAASDYQVQFAAAAEIYDMQVRTGNVDLELGGYVFTVASNMFVGFDAGDDANLQVAGGELRSAWADVGHYYGTGGAPGVMTLDGPGTTWVNDNDVTVGRGTSGTLYVTGGAGATMGRDVYIGNCFSGEQHPALGTLNVSGAWSSFDTGNAIVGVSAAGNAAAVGTLSVSQQATLTATGSIAVGSGAEGSVHVDTGATATCQGMTLYGHQGVASATIENSATLESSSQVRVGYGSDTGTSTSQGELYVQSAGQLTSYKGASPTGTAGTLGAHANGVGYATISGPGASWTMPDGGLRVGWLGYGELTVEDGGLVECVEASVARMAGSTGVVTLYGVDSTWNVEGDLSVGGSLDEAGGTGQVDVIPANSFVRVGHGAGGGVLRIWPDGSVTLTDGRMVVGGDAFAGPGSAWVDAAGTLDLKGGQLTAADILIDGQLTGEGSLHGDVEVNGLIAPGTSPGTISIDGLLALAGSAEFEIQGVGPGESDLVRGDVGPDRVSFGGQLDLSFTGTYQAGDSVQLFDFDEYAGDFDEMMFSGLGSGQYPVFDPTTGIVTVLPEPGALVMLVSALAGLGLIGAGKRGRSSFPGV